MFQSLSCVSQKDTDPFYVLQLNESKKYFKLLLSELHLEILLSLNDTQIVIFGPKLTEKLGDTI